MIALVIVTKQTTAQQALTTAHVWGENGDGDGDGGNRCLYSTSSRTDATGVEATDAVAAGLNVVKRDDGRADLKGEEISNTGKGRKRRG